MITFTRAGNVLAALLFVSATQAAFGSSIDYLSLTAQNSNGSTQGQVGANLSYDSTTGATASIGNGGGTIYSEPTALGLTSATITASSSDYVKSCIPSACVAGTVTSSTLATGNLATGSVGVSGFTSALNAYTGTSADETARLTDSLTFQIGGASSSTVTDIGITFKVDGTVSPGTYLPGNSNTFDTYAILTDSMRFGGGIIDYVFDSADNPANNIIENQGWVSSSILSESPDSFIFNGVYALSGSSDTLPISLLLELQCGHGASCDVSHTGAVSFTLPSNVTFSSASGVFLTSTALTTVPEPAYTVVLAAALLGIGTLARRRKRHSSAS